MNKLLKELSLAAGGSHYPSINPNTQEVFARLVIAECIKAVQRTDRALARTSYDHSVVEGTIQQSIKSINEHFGLKNESPAASESNQIFETR